MPPPSAQTKRIGLLALLGIGGLLWWTSRARASEEAGALTEGGQVAGSPFLAALLPGLGVVSAAAKAIPAVKSLLSTGTMSIEQLTANFPREAVAEAFKQLEAEWLVSRNGVSPFELLQQVPKEPLTQGIEALIAPESLVIDKASMKEAFLSLEQEFLSSGIPSETLAVLQETLAIGGGGGALSGLAAAGLTAVPTFGLAPATGAVGSFVPAGAATLTLSIGTVATLAGLAIAPFALAGLLASLGKESPEEWAQEILEQAMITLHGIQTTARLRYPSLVPMFQQIEAAIGSAGDLVAQANLALTWPSDFKKQLLDQMDDQEAAQWLYTEVFLFRGAYPGIPGSEVRTWYDLQGLAGRASTVAPPPAILNAFPGYQVTNTGVKKGRLVETPESCPRLPSVPDPAIYQGKGYGYSGVLALGGGDLFKLERMLCLLHTAAPYAFYQTWGLTPLPWVAQAAATAPSLSTSLVPQVLPGRPLPSWSRFLSLDESLDSWMSRVTPRVEQLVALTNTALRGGG